MTDESQYGAPPPPPWGSQPPPQYSAPPPQYGAPPPYGYQYPNYGYGQMGYGPPGQTRSTGISILLFFATFSIYGYVYNYQVHDEMKRHTGRGVGGGIALLLTFLAHVAMPFVTPAEVGGMYKLRGEPEPVNGWTGLWALLPVIGGYIGFFVLLVASEVLFMNGNGDTATAGQRAAIIATFVLLIGGMIAGGITWFVKTNGALNRYWESLGVPAA